MIKKAYLHSGNVQKVLTYLPDVVESGESLDKILADGFDVISLVSLHLWFSDHQSPL